MEKLAGYLNSEYEMYLIICKPDRVLKRRSFMLIDFGLSEEVNQKKRSEENFNSSKS